MPEFGFRTSGGEITKATDCTTKVSLKYKKLIIIYKKIKDFIEFIIRLV